MARPLQSVNTEFQDTGSISITMDDFRRVSNMAARVNKTNSMESEFKMVKRKTTFFKRKNIFLVRSGTSEEKWLHMCAALAKSV